VDQKVNVMMGARFRPVEHLPGCDYQHLWVYETKSFNNSVYSSPGHSPFLQSYVRNAAWSKLVLITIQVFMGVSHSSRVLAQGY